MPLVGLFEYIYTPFHTHNWFNNIFIFDLFFIFNCCSIFPPPLNMIQQVWQSILAVRSLLDSKCTTTQDNSMHNNPTTWVKFASLCRKSGRFTHALKTLKVILFFSIFSFVFLKICFKINLLVCSVLISFL